MLGKYKSHEPPGLHLQAEPESAERLSQHLPLTERSQAKPFTGIFSSNKTHFIDEAPEAKRWRQNPISDLPDSKSKTIAQGTWRRGCFPQASQAQ